MPGRDAGSIRLFCTLRARRILVLLAVAAISGGCASVVGQPPPTMAHVHVGHTLTGWSATPDKRGLLQIAEAEATVALENALAADAASDPARTRQHVRDVLHAIDPSTQTAGAGHGYGLKRAVTDATAHLGYAAESADSSGNLVRSMQQIAPRSQQIIDRCEQVMLFGEAVAEATSDEEIEALTSEILTLIRQIVDGDVGPAPGRYGLLQMRQEIEAMVARETPAYETVSSWYLFNLVRMPDGTWEFASDNLLTGAARY